MATKQDPIEMQAVGVEAPDGSVSIVNQWTIGGREVTEREAMAERQRRYEASLHDAAEADRLMQAARVAPMDEETD